MAAEDTSHHSEQRLNFLVVAAQNGDQKNYQLLFHELLPVLRSFLYHRVSNEEDREDLIQDIFTSIHRSLHTYLPQKPFLAWVFAIARYKMIDYFRQEGRLGKIRDKILESFARPLPEAGQMPELDLAALLQTLPEKQKRVIHYLKIDRLSIKEVSKITGMSEAAVKVTAHRGYKTLKAKYNEN